MKALTITLLAIGSLSAAPAADQPRTSTARPDADTAARFEALDRNDDKQVSKVEAKADAALSARFADVDVNLDGYITKAEYHAATVRMKQREREQQQ